MTPHMVPPLVAQRLANHRFAGERWAQPAEVVRWMGAMQAQDYHQALWSIGVRMQSATVAVVERAIADRQILRTWPMRGTIHFVPAADARWLVNLSAPRMLARDVRRQALLELDAAILGQCRDVVQAALQGHQQLARPAMMQVLEAAGIRTKSGRGYHILWYLAQTGVICFGPLSGKQPTFVLLDEWVPAAHNLARDEALATLAGRYIASHGPATAHDFAWWAGLTLTLARRGLAAATPALRQVELDGTGYWLAPDAPVAAICADASACLLPGFDEYLLGYQERSAILAAEHATKVVPGGNGIFQPMIVVAGQIVGTWKPGTRGVTLDPFIPLDAWSTQLDTSAQGYQDFLG